jgi:hypothetical protein
MKPQDLAFCKEHIINFESVKLGFTRNIPFNVLGEYERMYKEYLDAQFSLTYWCGECVFDMLRRLITFYEQSNVPTQTEQVQALEQSEKAVEEHIQVIKKRGRPKK